MQTNGNNIFDLIGPSHAEPSKVQKTGQREQSGKNSRSEGAAVPFDMIFGSLHAGTTDSEAVVDSSTVVMRQITEEQTEEFVQALLQSNIKELMQQKLAELSEGKYKVLHLTVNDKNVDMLLSDADGKQIQITLPLDSIEQLHLMSGNRINVDKAAQNKQLASLLEQMNVKEITVKAGVSEDVQSGVKPLEISLVGENQGNEIVLKSKLRSHQILTKAPLSTENPGQSSQRAAVLDESGIWDHKHGSEDASQRLFSPENGKNQLFKIEEPSTIEQMLAQKMKVQNGSANRLDGLLQQMTSLEHADRGETKEVPRVIRMQLPENLKTILRPNGQEVSIRINPENLGPAKLSLKFHDEKLTAKLMVTSVHAKEMLDSSVSRLIDQLHKVDINVDKIDIILSGEEKQQEQFNRRNEYNRKMTFKNLHSEDLELTDVEQAEPQWLAHNNSYVTTSGVNLLA